jgi:osmoprotectant transport system permease protein
VSFLEYFASSKGEIFEATVQHIGLVAVAMLIAVAVGVPLGIAATRHAAAGRWVMMVANVMQTVPSLALFGLLIPLPLLGGIGSRTAIVALTVYALLPIIRNTHVGIKSVDPAVIEAARGMGLTDRQLLTRVELPLSAGVILAGIRVATVISIGIATIAAAIGAGGLGTFIFRGLSMVNNQLILAGAIPAAFLAILADAGFGWLERRLRADR